MTVSAIQLIRDDGYESPRFRTNAPSRDAAVRASLAVMLSEVGTAYAHRLHFFMADGSLVVARAKPSNQQGA